MATILKIKDNVNLKVLEKYGFKYKPYINKDVIYGKTIVAFEDDPDYLKCELYVYEGSRNTKVDIQYRYKIKANEPLDGMEIVLPTIYDLVKADLVEKTED